MEIRFIAPTDDRSEISRVYEESWKFAYKGIVPQSYLDSIPEGRWTIKMFFYGFLRRIVEQENSMRKWDLLWRMITWMIILAGKICVKLDTYINVNTQLSKEWRSA